ncbi:uncharacterized protein M421DRAFT_388062 [Didymella exigua CBS 183.55]|uniref:SMP-LTD domain-containing protein n=1 Tax=Didymella exigua CBS 183.55 TaxID=1150837 RepID=A0A6A5S2Z0_9PLEO|nr:uncharacterized protein M421DRAFT_388062 [Didymella exigua CBS 183.55]KAF1933804.1 hypothetical protein M421DRAFT_388062 [Didymella exigua CBS 183.55]
MSVTESWGYGTLLRTFLWGYLIGGLTLLPAVAAFAWYWATTHTDAKPLEEPPNHLVDQTKRRRSNGSTKEGRDEYLKSLGVGLDEQILEGLKRRTHEADVFAGYFAVCREYVPGGVNGKPPERTTPAGAIVAMESPSIYQSMYSNIFNRNKTMSPSLDAPNTKTKKARNVFYVVLRLGHLMLYDNEDQLDVRHVISLARYEVDVYAGGERIPEGELWIKRNCIRLDQKLESDPEAEAKSFYLFSDNCSEKEDFYHAMLQAKDHHQDHANRQCPVPIKFETPDLVKLVQQLHANEENLHTRWINALIGRVFLALYKTPEIKNFIATKVTKKIARVPKPALISSVQLRKIDMGTLPPFITNPRLKELTVDGDLIVEADVSYKGNFRIEIEATARIDLGQRFKAREVTLVLGCFLKRLEGHLLLRIKPPPSNRLWMTFETPPRLELSVEPVVSSRQITYGPILRAIESRIKEVLNETLVSPNWDDMPFMDTVAQTIRGGIWEGIAKDEVELDVKVDEFAGLDTASVETEKLDTGSIHSHLSVPSSVDLEEVGLGVTSGTDLRSLPVKARSLRSTPSVKLGSKNASTETLEPSLKSTPHIIPLNSPLRSNASDFASISPDRSAEDESTPTLWSKSSHSAPNLPTETDHSRSKSKEDLTPEQIAAAFAAAHSAQTSTAKKQTLNQSFNAAAGAARNWLAAKQTQGQIHRKKSSVDSTHLPIGVHIRDGQFHDGEAPVPVGASSLSQPPTKSHTEPMGRGQPLPPPGTPLPPPPGKQKAWGVPIQAASALANLAKRKPVSGGPAASMASSEKKDFERPGTSQSSTNSSLYQLQQHDDHDSHTSANGRERGVPRRKSSSASTTGQNSPTLPKRRQRQLSESQHSNSSIRHSTYHDGAGEEVFIVEAPLAEVSAPPSPAAGVSKQLREGKASDESTGKVSKGSSLRSMKAEDEVGHGTFPFA